MIAVTRERVETGSDLDEVKWVTSAGGDYGESKGRKRAYSRLLLLSERERESWCIDQEPLCERLRVRWELLCVS